MYVIVFKVKWTVAFDIKRSGHFSNVLYDYKKNFFFKN